jgi:vacuolar iron transporter family protein
VVLGGGAAKVADARVVAGALRVALWSALAMGVTAGAGALLGTAL